MSVMEGPLSKWTNVMKGWQYRWFVLDDSAGLLSYYTSKEKMVRGTRRGCVRLKGAVVGIDDDDDSTFTITVDAKTFHFQAHDADEREQWIRSLEDTVLRHAPSLRRWDHGKPSPTMADFDKKLTESDAYLQLLIDQTNQLSNHILNTNDQEDRIRCQQVLEKTNDVLESIKHSIVLLQIAKNTAFPVNGVYHPCNAIPDRSSGVSPPLQSNSDELTDSPVPPIPVAHVIQQGIEVGHECGESVSNSLLLMSKTLNRRHDSPVSPTLPNNSIPEISYSSSEDESFFDADEYTVTGPSLSPSGPRLFEDAVETIPGRGLQRRGSDGTPTSPLTSPIVPQSPISPVTTTQPSTHIKPISPTIPDPKTPTPVESSLDQTIDYDAMYETDDEDVCSMESHGSVIQHLLSQVKIGMDLTKVVLPTFILERRSLLEMYADFFAHPDFFVGIADFADPQERMVQVVKWYLSAFHAGRRSEVAKKPYNPILGEVFRCYWDLPNDNSNEDVVPDGPCSWAKANQLSFVAEQVSHHPPISAFYAEHKQKRIAFCGHIWTKSKFLGLSVCVNNIGQGCVSLLDRDEEYILNFPSGYCRSILTVPWVELGGTCQITCSKTGYNANIEFLTKPFYGGKKHKISAEVFNPGEKKPFLNIEGEWNGVMNAKWQDGSKSEVFIDTQSSAIVKKNVKPVANQEINESRFMWKDVTANLAFDNINEATAAKYALEQKQREDAKHRKTNNLSWDTKLFSLAEENWIYNTPLQKRCPV